MTPRVIEGRVPPQALDVERTVLGSMMIDAAACDTGLETLTENHFYSTAHKRVLLGIQHVAKQNLQPDILSVIQSLKSLGWLEPAGSEAYLSELVENVATSANIAYHVDLLDEKRRLRELIITAADITSTCFERDADAGAILDRAEQRVFEIGKRQEEARLSTILDIVPAAIGHIGAADDNSVVHGLMTGYAELDEQTTGFHPGDLVIVAGRPGMAKTSFGLNVALNVCLRDSAAVFAFFSLEMSKEQIVQRLIAIHTSIEMRRIRTGRLTSPEKTKIGLRVKDIVDTKIIIDDSPYLTPMQARSRARRIQRKHGRIVGMAIDYMQRMRSGRRHDKRQEEVSEICRTLKSTAREMEIPVIPLCQLSRLCEQRGKDKRPILSDLRESGDIEQDADLALFLYRDEVYNAESQEAGIAEVIIEKQRNGPTGTVKLAFEKKSMRFDSLAGSGFFDDRKTPATAAKREPWEDW